MFRFLFRIHACFVGYVFRMQIVGCFDISDVFLISCVYTAASLSYVRTIASVALQFIGATRVFI